MKADRGINRNDAFSSCHPVVNLIFFGLVISFSMIFMHPVCLAISLFCAFAYAVYLKGRDMLKLMSFCIPLMLFTAALNPLFSHAGQTVLTFLPSGNPLTLESVMYGVAASIMLVSVIFWFSCINAVMSSDKLVFLFGRIIPSLSLVLSMTLRFVPRFAAQFKEVNRARKCIGFQGSNIGFMQRIKNGLTVLSVMVTWSMENSIETADSMKSRGYGLSGRTLFSIYRFDRRDRILLLWLMFIGAYVVVAGVMKAVYWRYFPTMCGADLGLWGISVYVAYFALCITPVAIDLREDRRWKFLQLKI